MRWLVISPYLPHPEIGHGGGTAVRQLCEELAESHDTSLLCFERENEHGRAAWLQERGVRVHTLPFASDQARGLARLPLFADRARIWLRQRRSDRPFMVEKYDRAILRNAIDRLLDSSGFDVVQVEYSFLAPAAAHARAHPHRPAVLLNTHEIASLPRERELARVTDPSRRKKIARELARWTRHESNLDQAADKLLCVTRQDHERLASELGPTAPIETVPLGYDLPAATDAHCDAATPPRLLFVGGFQHPPNAVAASCLLEEILPALLTRRPDVQLDLVGAHLPEKLEARARAMPNVTPHGFVQNLDPLWRKSTLFVAPLFTGGGIKIKILEAMARGAAIVTTPVGAEGIDDSGVASAICRTPDEIVQSVDELLGNSDRRSALSQAAREHFETHYTWPQIVRRLTAIAESVRAGRA